MFSLDTWNTDFPMFSSKPASFAGERKLTKDPINTGTSVLGVVFQGGVVLAADNVISYGSMARFTDVQRIVKVNKNTIMGASGDFADFQYIQDLVQQRVIEDQCIDDGFTMKPKALYNWLSGTLYKRRSKFDPLWNSLLIAGIEGNTPFLGFVDKLGAAYQDKMIATGFGAYIALPLIRKSVDEARPRGGLTEPEAIALIEKCLEVLYYRDARSWPKYTLGVVTQEGVRILGPLELKSNWEVATYVVD